MKWKTEEMVELCKNLLPQSGKIEIGDAYAEYITDVVLAKVDDKDILAPYVRILGFNDEHIDIINHEDADVPMIELCDMDADGDGGIQTTHEETAIFATRLRIALEKKGWSVVRQLENYF